MANTATIRAWYSTGGYYVYWNVSNIADPLSEYTAGGGYPLASTLSDFCVTRYDNPDDSNKELLLLWNGSVADGYTVYSTSSGAPNYNFIGRLALADDYSTAKVIGVATTTNRARLFGSYSVWCETIANPGDNLYLSPTNDGMVTTVPPITSGYTMCIVGVAAARKTTSTPGRLLMNIKIDEPILFEETI